MIGCDRPRHPPSFSLNTLSTLSSMLPSDILPPYTAATTPSKADIRLEGISSMSAPALIAVTAA